MRRCMTVNVLLLCLTYPSMGSGTNVTCGGQVLCPEDRPKRDGCCPLLGGELCDDGAVGLCDSELGYNCTNGICKGFEHRFNVNINVKTGPPRKMVTHLPFLLGNPFAVVCTNSRMLSVIWCRSNLKVLGVGETTVRISWEPFLTSPLRYEYSVLYTTDFSRATVQWNSHGVENRTDVTLYGLVPNTWYFSRIGIWLLGKYSNLTETIIFRTKAKDHCIYDGRKIAVGEKLIVEQCEESCICRPNGTFHCVPICRKHDQETPVCSDYFTEPFCCDEQHQCTYDNCTYLGESVRHDTTWMIDCAENCSCFDGTITCAPHCYVPIKPKRCPVEPVLGKSTDGCCDVWECREPENVCYYENNTISPGTIFFHGNCQLCTCSADFRETKCIDFHHCGSTEIPERTPVCPDPILMENSCCNQVICQNIESELDDVIELWTVSKFSDSSLVIRFQFISEADERDVNQIIFFYTTNTDVELPNWNNFTFNISEANTHINSSNLFIDFGAHNVLYKIDKSYFFVIPYLGLDVFYYLVMSVEFTRNFKSTPGLANNSTNASTFWSDTIATKISGSSFTTPSALSRSIPTEQTMAFVAENTSSSSAFLSWTVPTSFKYKIVSYVIKYKPLSAKNWFYTERLIFTERDYLLTCLFHTKWYEAHLLAIPGERRLGTTFFTTLTITESTNEKYQINIVDVNIDVTSASIHWFRLSDDVIPSIFNMEVLWSQDQAGGDSYKYCINGDIDSYTIDDLVSGTMYTVWLAVNLRSGQTVYSHRVHFVTSSLSVTSHSNNNNHSIIVAITVSCISLFTMVTAIATILYITRCKRRMQYQAHSSFENQIFQIYSHREEPEL